MGVNICNTDKKIGFIGAGKMASAITGGIVKSGFIDSKNVFAFYVSPEALKSAKENFNVNTRIFIALLGDRVYVVVIATKPFVAQDVLKEVGGTTTGKLVIFGMAGFTTSKIEAVL